MNSLDTLKAVEQMCREQRAAKRALPTPPCRSCGKPLPRARAGAYDCGGECRTVSLQHEQWGVWHTVHDYDERAHPFAVSGSVAAAYAVRRLKPGAYVAPYTRYSHRPWLACDQAAEDAREAARAAEERAEAGATPNYRCGYCGVYNRHAEGDCPSVDARRRPHE